VQALPSLQGLAFGTNTQAPVPASHMSSVHGLLSPQITGAPAHWLPWQTSPVVQATPSLQLVPFAFDGFEHVPVDGLQAPASWH